MYPKRLKQVAMGCSHRKTRRMPNVYNTLVTTLPLGVEHRPIIVSQLHRRKIQNVKMTVP